MKVRVTYKYLLKLGDKIIDRGITDNLELREVSHQAEFPGSRVVQVGRRTTRQAALEWERKVKSND